MITINNEQNIPIDTDLLKKDAEKILAFLGYKTFDLGILLASKEYIHELNKKYRNKDKPTDILSFAYYPDLKAGQKVVATTKEDQNLGDLIICPEYVQEDLNRWQQTFPERMRILLVHGICHLLGYDHIKDEDYAQMQEQETAILNMLEKSK
jgi:rRNA maturation RNase YbeY